jgi:hypothetical protein
MLDAKVAKRQLVRVVRDPANTCVVAASAKTNNKAPGLKSWGFLLLFFYN